MLPPDHPRTLRAAERREDRPHRLDLDTQASWIRRGADHQVRARALRGLGRAGAERTMSARTGRDAGAGGARARAKQRASHGRTHSAGRRWLWLTGVVALAVLAYVGPLRNQASP